MMTRLRCLFAMLAFVVIVGLSRSTIDVGAAPRLDDLRGVDELKTLFNRDVGKVRLVLLLSPT